MPALARSALAHAFLDRSRDVLLRARRALADADDDLAGAERLGRGGGPVEHEMRQGFEQR